MPIEDQLIYLNAEIEKHSSANAVLQAIKDIITSKIEPQINSINAVLAKETTFESQLKAKDDTIVLLQDRIKELETAPQALPVTNEQP